MVYLPAFHGVNFEAFRAAEEVASEVETYKNAIDKVQQVRTEQLISAQKAVSERQLALEQAAKAAEVVRTNRHQISLAVEGIQEFARQQRQIKETLQKVQSVVDVVRQFNAPQWAAMAGLTGVAITTWAPLWMSVSGMATPVGQLPTITLTDIAFILSREAGTAASVAMDVAWYHFESALADQSKSTIAMYLFACLLAMVMQTEPWTKAFDSVMRWLPGAVAAIQFILKNLRD